MNNWLFIIVCAILILFTAVGYFKGFIKLSVSLVSLIVTVFAVQMATPHVSRFLKEATPLYTTIQKMVNETMHIEELPEEEISISDQTNIIQNFSLPDILKGALVENNNSEIYQILEVQRFKDYVSNYITHNILNTVSYLLAFIFIYMVFGIAIFALDVVSRLPGIRGLNKIAGGFLGLVEGLIFIWLACLVLTAFAGTDWGRSVFGMIESNKFLTFLYEHNLFSGFVFSLITAFL